ncbi:MAG: ribose-phosphate pyrophosphokinase [Actinobacteria bacterium]|nr:MAG: ribose-phosphate pyrophosphokinase [Actinomycetota bacterium]
MQAPTNGGVLSRGLKKELVVLSGSSSPQLAEEIASHLKQPVGRVQLSRFSDGEIYVRSEDSVRGSDAFIIQTLSPPINDNIMELLILIDAQKRASTDAITAVVPYYAYARQDKKGKSREPITAKLLADLLTVAGISRLCTMDVHADSIQGFFNVPVDHLTAMPLLASYFKKKGLEDLVVVSPDVGRVKSAKKFADRLKADLAIMHKIRPSMNHAEILEVVGEVDGKNCLLVDDMVDTAGTMVEAARALKARGAKAIFACATHPVLSGPAKERLKDSPIEQIVFTNSLAIPKEKMLDKYKVLSIAPLFAQVIQNIHNDESVSSLFDGNV